MGRTLRIIGIVAFVLAAGLFIVALFKPHSPLSGDVANDPALVKRGEYLATAGDCRACHTAGENGKAFAGGLAFPIAIFGKVYSPNITPDAKTGTGGMSLAQFDRAVRFGIGKDGGNLYPAMPYVSYAKISDVDIKALYAYFKYGVAPVAQPRQAGTIRWPFSIRWPVQLWNRLYYDGGRYQPKPNRDALWNRGAYLVQGLAHCGTCHTPRGVAMQEVALDETRSGYLGGEVLAGWQAYNITGDKNAGIGGWSPQNLFQYLSTGDLPGVAQAAGPMADAIEHSFSKLSSDDVRAIVTYIKTVPAVGDGSSRPRQNWGAPSNAIAGVRGLSVANDGTTQNAAQLFIGNCATCHGWTGSGTKDAYYPSLYRNSTVGAPNPTNLAQVILHGINRKAGGQDISMPRFADDLSDQEVAALANFLTAQFGNKSATITPAEVKKLR